MTKNTKTVGTLQEIGARVGDVVGNSWGTIGRTVDQDMIYNWTGADYRIVSRAQPAAPAATDGPVRTVTRKEIVPGVYGEVEVVLGNSAENIGIRIEAVYFTHEDMTAIIETLTQIRDAMQEQQQ